MFPGLKDSLIPPINVLKHYDVLKKHGKEAFIKTVDGVCVYVNPRWWWWRLLATEQSPDPNLFGMTSLHNMHQRNATRPSTSLPNTRDTNDCLGSAQALRPVLPLNQMRWRLMSSPPVRALVPRVPQGPHQSDTLIYIVFLSRGGVWTSFCRFC